MKKLIDYKEEIHTCSKCGLCQSVCPVYEITGNDCSVSRGKFIMLNGIIRGDLELNKNIDKYLSMCLKCNACKNFCPSNIDAREIFLSAKAEYFKQNKSAKITALFQSKFVFKTFLAAVKLAASVYRVLKIDKIMPNFYPLLLKMGWLGKKIILANEFVSENIVPHYSKSTCHAELDSASNQQASTGKIPQQVRDDKESLKVIYFKGCVNEFVNPTVKNSVENILSRLGVEILPADFDCCGMPFLSCGNVEQFEKQAVFNLSKIQDEFDYFLTDCASCKDAFKEYKKVVTDENLLKKIDKILEKSVNINEFLVNNINRIEFEKNTSVTFHKPCHLDDMSFLQKILDKSKNLEYIEMTEFDKCCGFSGEFAIKNPELSGEISKKKAQNALAACADYILTSCPACTLGLTQGLIEHYSENTDEYNKCKKLPKVLNLVEFIAKAEIS